MDFATKTIHSASDMASTYSQLAAEVGTKNTTEHVKWALVVLVAAAENPQQAMKTLSQQANLNMKRFKVHWHFKPGDGQRACWEFAAVAKETAWVNDEMVRAVQDVIKTEDFFDAITRAGK